MTSRDDALSLLRQSFETFVPIPEEAWAEIRQPWSLREVQKGDVLTRQGENENTFSLVVEGVQRGFFVTPDGRDVTAAFIYPPGYSGVPDAFFLRQPSAYTLEALTDGLVLATGYSALSGLMDKHRALDRWAWRLLATALSGRAKREREMQTLTAEERYARFVRESAHVLGLAPLHQIATYLGMSPETLSRVRAGRS